MPRLILIVAVIVVVFVLGRKLLSLASPSRDQRVAQLWDQLRQLTGDSGVARRLVDGEKSRHPEFSELECLQRAIRQLRHDRH